MKLQKVSIKEYKKLKDIEFTPEGHNVLIIGENGLGKSTIIQFIQIALGKQDNIPPMAFGEGVVVVNKDGSQYTLKVAIKEGKSVVTVITQDGLKDNRKGAIASLVGPISFDIEQFVNLSKSKSGRKEQVEIVKGFFPVATREEIKKYENNLVVEEEERTQIGRDRDKLDGSIRLNALINTNLDKYEFTDLSKVSDDLKAANDHNSKIVDVESRKQQRNQAITNQNSIIIDAEIQIENKKKEILALEQKVAASKKLIDEEKVKNIQADEWIKSNPIKPTADFETAIKNATDNNNKYNDAQKLKKDIKELELLETQYGEQTVKIELTRQAIQDCIRDTFNDPDSQVLEGLSFDDEKLIYNGFPVHPESQSESEIMTLGAKLKLCENRELGILLLERTESFGEKRWQEILQMCEKEDLQLIGEFVQRGQEELMIEIQGE